jgi:hypothetical protein
MFSPAGVAQGIVTGIRGLCNGLGPALFGFIFYLFHVDLNSEKNDEESASSGNSSPIANNSIQVQVQAYFSSVHGINLDFIFFKIKFMMFCYLKNSLKIHGRSDSVNRPQGCVFTLSFSL